MEKTKLNCGTEQQANKMIKNMECVKQLNFIKIKEYSEQTSHYLSTFYTKISNKWFS